MDRFPWLFRLFGEFSLHFWFSYVSEKKLNSKREKDIITIVI